MTNCCFLKKVRLRKVRTCESASHKSEQQRVPGSPNDKCGAGDLVALSAGHFTFKNISWTLWILAVPSGSFQDTDAGSYRRTPGGFHACNT
jgi:hypothetical protein